MAAGDWLRDRWQWRRRQGVDWAGDSLLLATGLVEQGFSGCRGGVSRPPWAGLNISYGSGDEPLAVGENRRRLAEACDLPANRWCGVRQVHGTEIKLVTGADAGIFASRPGPDLPAADGLITKEAGVVLVTLHADCIPLYILDPKTPAIGLGHAGWRGSLDNIAGALVDAMAAAFGSQPADLLASIGPGAGPCHYEVAEPVLSAVRQCFAAAPELAAALLRPSGRPERAYLDLWQANAWLLAQKGVPAGQISVAGICTICERDLTFSHRRGDRGRQAAFLMLKHRSIDAASCGGLRVI